MKQIRHGLGVAAAAVAVLAVTFGGIYLMRPDVGDDTSSLSEQNPTTSSSTTTASTTTTTSDAVTDVEKIYQQGYDAGYQAGYEEGKESQEGIIKSLRVTGEFTATVCDIPDFTWSVPPEDYTYVVLGFFQDEAFLCTMKTSVAAGLQENETYVFTVDGDSMQVPAVYLLDDTTISRDVLMLPYTTSIAAYSVAEENELGMASLCDLSYEITEE